MKETFVFWLLFYVKLAWCWTTYPGIYKIMTRAFGVLAHVRFSANRPIKSDETSTSWSCSISWVCDSLFLKDKLFYSTQFVSFKFLSDKILFHLQWVLTLSQNTQWRVLMTLQIVFQSWLCVRDVLKVNTIYQMVGCFLVSFLKC